MSSDSTKGNRYKKGDACRESFACYTTLRKLSWVFFHTKFLIHWLFLVMGANNLCGCARTPERVAFSQHPCNPWSWLCRVNTSWSTPSFSAQPIRRVTVELWCIWKGCLVSEASSRSGTPREGSVPDPLCPPLF